MVVVKLNKLPCKMADMPIQDKKLEFADLILK